MSLRRSTTTASRQPQTVLATLCRVSWVTRRSYSWCWFRASQLASSESSDGIRPSTQSSKGLPSLAEAIKFFCTLRALNSPLGDTPFFEVGRHARLYNQEALRCPSPTSPRHPTSYCKMGIQIQSSDQNLKDNFMEKVVGAVDRIHTQHYP